MSATIIYPHFSQRIRILRFSLYSRFGLVRFYFCSTKKRKRADKRQFAAYDLVLFSEVFHLFSIVIVVTLMKNHIIVGSNKFLCFTHICTVYATVTLRIPPHTLIIIIEWTKNEKTASQWHTNA